MRHRRFAPRPARRLGFASLVLLTLLWHALLADRVVGRLHEVAAAADAPARLQVRLVQELRPTEPPAPPAAVAVQAAPKPARRAAAASARHASRPAESASEPIPP